jgi:hypothetical protein
MSAAPPLWRRTFDRTERLLGRPLEEAVSTREFTDVLLGVFRVQKLFVEVFEGYTRAVWHFWNLPARTDVARMQRQLAALAAEVRELAARLEEGREER